MSDLGPQRQNQSYNSLLQIPGGITSSLQTVTDGDGNPTALSISTTQVSGLNVVGNTALNLANGSAGQVPYQTGAGATSFISNGTAGQYLRSNGSSAPSWVTIPTPPTPPTVSIANVVDYGASPSNSPAANTTAFQAAFNSGKMVYVPAGYYEVNPGLTTTGPGMYGDGPRSSLIIHVGSFSTSLVTWNGTGGSGYIGPVFRDIGFQTNVYSQTDGALLNIAPSQEVQQTFVENCFFNSGYDGLRMINTPLFKVIGCYFSNASRAGVFVQNLVDVDSGDSAITSCNFGAGFYSVVDEQSGVLQYSSGGLKITNCKFLGGNHGYFMNAYLPNKGVGDLLISNCSIETNKYAGIKFRRLPQTTSATTVAISAGAKTLTTIKNSSEVPWVAGNIVRISSSANATNYMIGTVTSFSGTNLVVNVTSTHGSGTFSSWEISGEYGWGGIVINGNQIGTPLAAEATGSWCFIANDVADFLSDICITGNVFGVHNSNNSLGFDYNQDIYIASNKFYAPGGGVGSSAGVQIGANTRFCRVDYNDYRNFPTPINSASTTTSGAGFNQKGLATGIVTGSPYGSLYEGYVNVTFPIAFPPGTIPNISAVIAGGSGGGVSAWPQYVTNTGCQMHVISVNNSAGTTDVFWSAELEQFPIPT